jgi:cobyric acid synthase
MRFIRVNGRVVPIREKQDGNVDKRHVSNKKLAEAAATKKVSKKRIAKGAAFGAAAGALGIAAISKKAAWKGAILGSLIGAAAASTTFTTKQEVANRLKRRKKA